MHKLHLLLDAAHAPIAERLCRSLPTTVGCEPQQATTKETLLLLARREKADLAILNTTLVDGSDGLEACRQLKQIRPDLRVVVISPQHDHTTMERAVGECGADWYLRQGSLSFDELAWIAKQSLVSRLHRDGLLVEEKYRFLTKSPATSRALAKVDAISASQNTLIFGETGTGKELIARRIHANARAFDPKRPLKILDCSSLSPQIFESEVFGHRRGSFTGAANDRVGALQLVNGGDLFLDEIHNIPVHLQQKLLRALNDGVFSPVGSNEEIRSNFRVVAATNVPVEESISNGRLLPDFVARIQRISVSLPPLRTRPEDIELIVRNHLAQSNGFDKEFSPEAIRWMKAQEWKGNTRELKALVDTAIAETRIPIISATALCALTSPTKEAAEIAAADNIQRTEGGLPDPGGNLEGFIFKLESDYIRSAVSQYGSVRAAAKSLGYSNSRLQRRIRALGLNQQLSSSSLA